MPRITIAAVWLMATLVVSAADAPDAQFDRGLQAYRAADYAAAIADLDAAAQAYQASDRIESLETALIYLTLSHVRLGAEDAARATIQRLIAADRIRPAYATLPLAEDAADFDSIATALVPDSGLARAPQLESEDPSRPLPPVKRATARAATSAAITTLREADDAAKSGDAVHAQTVYAHVATEPEVAREALIEAAIGLYRVGAYRESAAAFQRIGTFARGEEDLRYYFAVALYESGEYHAAQKELACSLPFIETTEDVLRYRWKIENTAAVLAMKSPLP